MKYLLKIAFAGTAYCGYQVQKNGISVQEKLQDAVCRLLGKRYPLTGCSRTDSGVHARDFRATLETDEQAPCIPTNKLPAAINAYLPDDISVLDATVVPDDFHARYQVKQKEYEYLIYMSPTRNPFLVNRAWHYHGKLDAALMSEAAGRFIGKHDFSAFMASGSKIKNTVRTVYSCNITETENIVSVKISADGFLYNMVRIITGTLVAVSEGKIAVSDIDEIIGSGDRNRAGATVPACGLYLSKVEY